MEYLRKLGIIALMKKRYIFPLLGIALMLIFLNSTYWNAPKNTFGISALEKERLRPPLDSNLQVFLDDYQQFIQQSIKQEEIPGLAIVIVKDSQVIWQEGLGLRSIDSKDSIDLHSVFRIASLSKGFAPILAGILIDEGKLDWDDKVIDYVPQLKLKDAQATRDLSIRHLLSHTTGLPRHTYSNLLNQSVPYDKILSMLKEVDVAHPVGTYYNYQNVAYSLIGDVVQKITGKSYQNLLLAKVLQPLEMTDASVTYEGITKEHNIAYPHTLRTNGYTRKEISKKYYSVAPAAGVNASISDMTNWLYLLLGKYPEIIQPNTLQEILSPQVEVCTCERNLRSWKPLKKAAYGLGWRILNYKGMEVIYHGGYVNGYRAEIAFDPKEKIGVAILSNAASRFMAKSIPTFFSKYLLAMHQDSL